MPDRCQPTTHSCTSSPVKPGTEDAISVPSSSAGNTRCRVKICCLQSVDEIPLIAAAGVDAIGLVLKMPNGPGVLAEHEAAQIAAAVPPGISRWALSSADTVDGVLRELSKVPVDTVQLVDDEVPADFRQVLRSARPGLRIVQVLHVHEHATRAAAVESALRAAVDADALLLDSGSAVSGPRERVAPSTSASGSASPVAEANPPTDATAATDVTLGTELATTRTLGGTGRVHDWAISRAIVEAVAPCPVWLAGGLSPNNVHQAVAFVRPFGVDVCTGLRDRNHNLRLNPDRLQQFVDAVRDAARGG